LTSQRADNVRERANMVFVTVGDHYPSQLVQVLADIACVGNDEVDPQHIAFWEFYSGIDQYKVTPVLKECAVLANFTDAAKGDDAERRICRGLTRS
jgi:hypothetical protein